MPKPRILIVDDEHIFLKHFKKVMESSFEVVCCSSPIEARSAIANLDFMAVISDHRMPGESGTDFLNFCKKLRPGILTIMTSAYYPRGDADEFVVFDKPVNLEKIMKFLLANLCDAEHHDVEPTKKKEEALDIATKDAADKGE